MNDFLLIYRGSAPPASPDQAQQRMQKWTTWLKELSEQGHVRDAGHPLEQTGKTVKGHSKHITDGPYAETKDIIGGYSIIAARDLGHAAELSKGCPIFEFGGQVEVRPIMTMNM